MISGRIRNDQNVIGSDGMRAKCKLARRLIHIEANLGLEPLAILVDQRYQSDLTAGETLCQLNDGIKLALGRRVEKPQAIQSGKPRMVEIAEHVIIFEVDYSHPALLTTAG